MFILPDYLREDIAIIEKQLNTLKMPTSFLYPDLDTIKVMWESDDVAGEFRLDPDTNKYQFWVTQDTLDGLNEGHSYER